MLELVIMKMRAFLIHGWEGYPEEGWRPWLRDELKKAGFEVIVPSMPDADDPTMEKWVPYLIKVVGEPTENDFFVSHSLGCITTLRFIESLTDEKVGGAVLVAGFGHDLDYPGYKGELSSFFQSPLDWEKIKSHCNKFAAIVSDNDPFVPLEHGELFKEKLGAKLIIEHNKRHFSGDDGISTLPSAKNAVLSLAKY